MKIIEQAKNILGSAPLLAKILVGKYFSLSEEKVTGKLQLIAKVDCTITKITYEIHEHFEQAHNNATENKVYSLGSKNVEKNMVITPLEAQLIEFEVPLTVDDGSSGDTSVYSGDMALMNKFSDRAKKASSVFKLTATIDVKDYSQQITETITIKFK